MNYTDLTKEEQKVAETIENFFMINKSIKRKSFVRVLGFLINKYKIKKVD